MVHDPDEIHHAEEEKEGLTREGVLASPHRIDLLTSAALDADAVRPGFYTSNTCKAVCSCHCVGVCRKYRQMQ